MWLSVMAAQVQVQSLLETITEEPREAPFGTGPRVTSRRSTLPTLCLQSLTDALMSVEPKSGNAIAHLSKSQPRTTGDKEVLDE